MRIISDFNDYYDCIQSHGQDRSLVFHRTGVQVHIGKKWPFVTLPPRLWRNTGWTTTRLEIIGFCGPVYPLLRLSYKETKTCCYGLREADSFADANFHGRDLDIYHGRGGKRPGLRRKDVAEFFEAAGKDNADHRWRFVASRSPVFVARMNGYCPPGGREARMPQSLSFNACLRDREFQRIKDPYTAFQEIAAFIGNVAMPDRPIPHVSDEDMVAAKGFDKWSFRKESTRQ